MSETEQEGGGACPSCGYKLQQWKRPLSTVFTYRGIKIMASGDLSNASPMYYEDKHVLLCHELASFIFWGALGIEPRTLRMLSTCATLELLPAWSVRRFLDNASHRNWFPTALCSKNLYAPKERPAGCKGWGSQGQTGQPIPPGHRALQAATTPPPQPPVSTPISSHQVAAEWKPPPGPRSPSPACSSKTSQDPSQGPFRRRPHRKGPWRPGKVLAHTCLLGPLTLES